MEENSCQKILYTADLYLRLSHEDEDKEHCDSISNQRELLLKYLSDHSEIKLRKIQIDNGYSGTNDRRPGFQDMLEAVRHKEINCIIVKDFSRFARDYIMLGSYLEQIFPFMGVRFISVNDRYDSKDGKTCAFDMEVGFKNLLSDLYSRDLSCKVRASLLVKKENGEYISGSCPFGYKKMPENHGMLVVEKEEAKIVKRIFALTAQGYTSVQIARLFNQERVKTPMEYKIEKGRTTRVPKGDNFLWSSSSVCHILENRMYTGDMVYGRYEKDSNGKVHQKPKNQWKVYQNHHSSIIDRELFEKVQKRRKRKASDNSMAHPFIGRAVCGGCGRNLRYRSGLEPYFCCHQRYVNPGGEDVVKMDAKYLENYVLSELKKKLTESGELETLLQENRKELLSQIAACEKTLQGYLRKVANLRRRQIVQYQRFVMGEEKGFCLGEESLQELERKINEQKKVLDRLMSYKEKMEKNEQLWEIERNDKWLDRYIQRIVVQKEQTIIIEWRTFT